MLPSEDCEASAVGLVASDERSNPPETAEHTARVTERFDIDNTPPTITGITGESLGGGKVRLRFVATDSATPLSDACYAVDGGDPRPMLSVDGILDSESESFDVVIPALSPGEHVTSVRVKDTADNVASSKVIVILKWGPIAPTRGVSGSHRDFL